MVLSQCDLQIAPGIVEQDQVVVLDGMVMAMDLLDLVLVAAHALEENMDGFAVRKLIQDLACDIGMQVPVMIGVNDFADQDPIDHGGFFEPSCALVRNRGRPWFRGDLQASVRFNGLNEHSYRSVQPI